MEEIFTKIENYVWQFRPAWKHGIAGLQRRGASRFSAPLPLPPTSNTTLHIFPRLLQHTEQAALTIPAAFSGYTIIFNYPTHPPRGSVPVKVRYTPQGVEVGCPSKLFSIRNNRNWNRNQFRHYPKQKVCFGCFASIPKQRVSMFRLNRNKQNINRNKKERKEEHLFCSASSCTFPLHETHLIPYNEVVQYPK